MAERLSFKGRSKELIEFDVDGEVFHIAPLGGWAFFDIAEMAAGEAPTDMAVAAQRDAEQALVVKNLFRDHMDAETFERWEKFARGPSGPDIVGLMEIVQGVVLTTTGRPTQPPSPSGSGRLPTGTGSTDSASSPESTSQPSPSPEA